MNNIFNKLVEKELLHDFPDNTYQLAVLERRKNKTEISFNSSNNLLSFSKIAEYINSQQYTRVIFVCRSEKEPWADSFPSKSELDTLLSKLKCNYNIFYQEPWPTAVPNFNLKEGEKIFRFGFDEGLDINKWSIDSTLDTPVLNEYSEVLLTNKNIIEL